MAQRMVMCAKLHKELPGLDETPWPGELGQRIYDNISQEAFKEWTSHLRMLINEYRLVLANKDAQDFVAKQMEQFFFGEGAGEIPNFVPMK